MMSDTVAGPAEIATAAYFAGRAGTYRRASEHGLWAWQRRREAAAVMDAAGDVRGQAALELGCGAGFYARLLADAGGRPVVGVDAQPRMLAQIEDQRIEPVLGDAAVIDLGRYFHLILIAGLLEFASDAAAVLRNARRHVAPEGRLVVLLPPNNAAGRLYRFYHRRHGLEIALFDPARVAALAAESGLTVAAARPVPPYGAVYRLTP